MRKFLGNVKHVTWLAKTGIVNLIKGDFEGAMESLFWIKVHCSHRSKLIKWE